jgi:hypothetical protein
MDVTVTAHDDDKTGWRATVSASKTKWFRVSNYEDLDELMDRLAEGITRSWGPVATLTVRVTSDGGLWQKELKDGLTKRLLEQR